MVQKGFLICFTGMDGTGKTTLSKIIVDSLNKKGIKCEYVYARFDPIISKSFILLGGFIFIRNENQFKTYSEYIGVKKNALESHRYLSKLYQNIIILDYLIQLLIKIKLPLFAGKNIVCDRYIYDTIVSDLSVDMNHSYENSIKLLNIFYCIIPKPDIIFLMDVNEKIAYSRKDDLPSIKYLEERRDKYLQIGSYCNMVVLNGSKSLEELRNLIESVTSNELIIDETKEYKVKKFNNKIN